MPYQLSVQRKDGYLHVSVTGQNSRDSVQRYLMDVYNACLDCGCAYALVEENLSGRSLSMGDINQIASTQSEGLWPVVKAVAYVDTNPEHFPSRVEFATHVATTHGLNARNFENIQDAEKWLRETIQGAANPK